ncbi:unnamed protein product [Adineta steineri]|uniref:Ferritin-like diiron domain-containing protein n=1 Tax=Adineta steineri TaxID=433720 RepID=A0A814IUS8_9BILA|nr:unnamed protein product [Adineta steineri]CAF3818182.1 unnamed protein product [Adineta steineri]
MQVFYILGFIISLSTCIQATSSALDAKVGKCLSDLTTKEITISHNYLQLSSKFGTTNAYPGFSSLFTKLSDKDSHKSHELVKFIALRKFKLERLISKDGIKIHNGLTSTFDIREGLKQARDQNKELWKEVTGCHDAADKDANVQDYLESHLLDHHIEIDKLLADLEHRIDDAQTSDKKLITFMIDEELLETYGDRRKDIFS